MPNRPLSRWKNFRFYLEELGCRFLAWGIPRLSRPAAVRLANGLGALAYLLDGRGRAVALSNLECAFGARFGPAQRVEIARASYRNFLRTMLDLFWGQNLTRENFRDWVQMESTAQIAERFQSEKAGVVMMCVHQGNWEWASLAFGFLGVPTTIVAENFKNPRLTAIFRRLREHSGHRIIPQENSILRLLKVAKKRQSTGMLIDLSLPPTQASTVIEGFGMKMCVPLLHAVLAGRAGTRLMPVESRPLPDGRCEVIVHPTVEVPEGATLQDIAQRCWNAMEPIVQSAPRLYLWPYKHFRYKPKAAGRPYPYYANESGKFEKLLKTLDSPLPARRHP